MNSHLDIHSTPTPNESGWLAHLSDVQIDDQLIGDLAAGPAAHLAACPVCTDRVAAAADPLASFRNVTLAWSERRSATLPLPDLSRQTPLWQRHVAGAVACFAIVLGIALINASHQAAIRTAELQPLPLQSAQQAAIQQTATQQAAPQPAVLTETASIAVAPRAQQISADNRMLKAIDAELDTSADSLAALGIEPVSAHPGRPPTPISIQD